MYLRTINLRSWRMRDKKDWRSVVVGRPLLKQVLLELKQLIGFVTGSPPPRSELDRWRTPVGQLAPIAISSSRTQRARVAGQPFRNECRRPTVLRP
jgi:hypothetical protein